MSESYSSNLQPDLPTELQKLSEALDSGNLRLANRLKAKFLKYPVDTFTSELHAKFDLLDSQLKELDALQELSTKPLRTGLCEDMEALACEDETHPEEKAKKIKALQHSWRGLDHSSSKENQLLWFRFKAAGEKAFKECQQHFNDKKIQRDQNLLERLSICDKLNEFYLETDWQNPDWKAIDQTLKSARTQWKHFDDIPHIQRKAVRQRFLKALDPIQSLLGEELDKNHSQKQMYIEQIDELLKADIKTPSLIQKVKDIQSLWKQTGITARGKDQKLWIEFRKRCDEAFAKRDRSKEELNKTRVNVSKAADGARQCNEGDILRELRRKSDLCQQIENGADPELINGTWEGSIVLPDAMQRSINNRYQQALCGTVHYAEVEMANELCVRMEMLAHISSPEHSQGLRLKLQVERLDIQLSRGIKEQRSPIEQLTELQIKWYSLGAITAEGSDFEKRFLKSEAAIRGPAD